jgi:nicotinamidase-related amidase
MSKIDPRSTALLLVDIQQGLNHPTYYGSSRSTPQFENNVTKVLAGFRELRTKLEEQGPTIIHIYHSSSNRESPLHPESGEGIAFMPYARPHEGEPIISKHVNSAFIGTNLEEFLRERKIRQLVICGLTTDHCVSTTTRMAANLGVTDVVDPTGHTVPGRIILVEDAVAAFNKQGWDAETVHAVNLASLRDEFAEVMTAEQILAML